MMDTPAQAPKKDESIIPLHDRVIVKPAPVEEKTAGGILIPDSAKEKPMRGKVLHAGRGHANEPLTVKPGDNVLYSKYGGTEVTVDGEDCLIMRETDILAILPPDNPEKPAHKPYIQPGT